MDLAFFFTQLTAAVAPADTVQTVPFYQQIIPFNLVIGLRFMFIIALTFGVAKMFSWALHRFWDRSFKILESDPTRFRFIINFTIFGVYFAGFGAAVYSIPALRTFSVSLFAGAGVLAAIIGLASQQAFSNIISGIFIVIFKPFRVNDWIIIEDKHEGIVEDITVRHTVLRDFQNQRIVIPNSQVSATSITNMQLNDARIRKFVEVTIDYDSDVELAMKIMEEETLKHPLLLDSRTTEEIKAGVPLVQTRFRAYTEIGAKLRVVAWARNPDDAFVLFCDLNLSFKKAFDAHGIKIATLREPMLRRPAA